MRSTVLLGCPIPPFHMDAALPSSGTSMFESAGQMLLAIVRGVYAGIHLTVRTYLPYCTYTLHSSWNRLPPVMLLNCTSSRLRAAHMMAVSIEVAARQHRPYIRTVRNSLSPCCTTASMLLQDSPCRSDRIVISRSRPSFCVFISMSTAHPGSMDCVKLYMHCCILSSASSSAASETVW